jgi:alkylation response protein AidB-like acyl-CoA dehydrogenase
MDAFIEAEIVPLQAQYPQFFDERREFARTDLDRGGLPSREWEDLLARMRAAADAAGWLRNGLPASLGGQDGTNLDMAVRRAALVAGPRHAALGRDLPAPGPPAPVGPDPVG